MKVVFSEEANLKNQENIEYLIEFWNLSVLVNYIDKLNEIVNYLELNMISGRFDEKLGLYKILIVKQIYLFYELKHDMVLITTTWNTSKNPYWL